MNNLANDPSGKENKICSKPISTKKLNKKKLKALDKFEELNGISWQTLKERGMIFLDSENFPKAKLCLLKSLNMHKDLEVVHKLMLCMSHLKQTKEATQILEENLQHFQTVGPYWALFAFYALGEKQYETSFGAVLQAITIYDQNFPEMWKIFSLSGLMCDQHEKTKQISKSYMDKGTFNEFIFESFINSCLQLGDSKEGLDFLYSTTFDWKQYPILIGIAANLHGHFEKENSNQLKLNKKAVELAPENEKLRWNLALSQLRNGDIKEGLNNYEIRFEWDEYPSPVRQFKNAKRWHPDVDPDARIMLWFEQGIGDQLRFWSALPDFKKRYPNIILEPMAKTAEILQSSFPDLEVRWNNINPENLFSYEEDFDYHLPIGSMFGFEVQKHAEKLKNKDFSLNWNYLKPDKLRKMYWEQKLNTLSNKPKIGFCWRSQNTSGHRKSEYTELYQWQNLLQNPDFSFVNLQYDLSHEEFLEKYGDFEKSFLNTGHLDQKDDLEGALSLISNLDFVISASAAPSMISSASGIPTIIYSSPHMYTYGRLSAFSKCCLFGNSVSYLTSDVSKDGNLVTDISNYLIKRSK